MLSEFVDRNTLNTILVAEQKMTLNKQRKQIKQTEAELEVSEQKQMNANRNTWQGNK
jgi:hypothetical protein